MSSEYLIRLQIGIGSDQFFSQPMPVIFELLNWKCPAVIFDYVRFFEEVSYTEIIHSGNDSVDGAVEWKKCEDISRNSRDESNIVTNICQLAMKQTATTNKQPDEKENQRMVLDKSSFFKGNWCKCIFVLAHSFTGKSINFFYFFYFCYCSVSVLIIIMLLTFLGLLTYLIMQVIKMKRTVEKDSKRLSSTGGGLYEDVNDCYYNNACYDYNDTHYETLEYNSDHQELSEGVDGKHYSGYVVLQDANSPSHNKITKGTITANLDNEFFEINNGYNNNNLYIIDNNKSNNNNDDQQKQIKNSINVIEVDIGVYETLAQQKQQMVI